MSIVEIKGLIKNYNGIKAVDNLSIEIKKGEVFALLGPNGAGKTTTINIIMGFIFPTSGTVTILGNDILKNGKEARKRIGFMPEELGFYDTLTAYEHMKFYARLFGIPEKEREEKILHRLDQIGLLERKDSKVREYSYGMRR
ncbi:MAG: ABC transporter ATP-binding protein [Candidatus Thermoplasmatota archaeon]|nr:ABC transporter ATP-binding protein [Candidatus Thermoplasmatota archaeon]